jgi:hypothetical protein
MEPRPGIRLGTKEGHPRQDSAGCRLPFSRADLIRSATDYHQAQSRRQSAHRGQNQWQALSVELVSHE